MAEVGSCEGLRGVGGRARRSRCSHRGLRSVRRPGRWQEGALLPHAGAPRVAGARKEGAERSGARAVRGALLEPGPAGLVRLQQERGLSPARSCVRQHTAVTGGALTAPKAGTGSGAACRWVEITESEKALD